MSARAAAGLALLALCLSLAAAATTAAAAVVPRASLTDIERQVMCVTCGVPLNIAESPQAEHERAFIRELIAGGETTAQIKQALVAQLGPGVLALPERRGFNRAVYVVPVALIGALAAMLAVLLHRWRRGGGPGADAGDQPPAADLRAEDAARLDEELARYRG